MSKINPALYSSDKSHWETPRAFFERVHAEFDFTLDACATRRNALLPRFITLEDYPDDFVCTAEPDEMYLGGLQGDSLDTPWSYIFSGNERVWLNPPYGRGIERWIEKAYEESQAGNLVVALLPARTDTAWWHDWVEGKAEVRFIRGRLGFTIDGKYPLDKEGRELRSAPFPSVLAIYRPPNSTNEAFLQPREESEPLPYPFYLPPQEEFLAKLRTAFLTLRATAETGLRQLSELRADGSQYPPLPDTPQFPNGCAGLDSSLRSSLNAPTTPNGSQTGREPSTGDDTP